MTDAELAERRRRRLWLLGASGLLVAILVAIGIAFGSADDDGGTTTGPPEGVAETKLLYDGIAQMGPALGGRQPAVGVIEYADLQCPHCASFSRDVMPSVVKRYVRTGRVGYTLRLLTFIGEDSEEAARFAVAAGLQGKQYQVVDLIFRNQGAQNDGWVDEAYLARIGAAVGVDVNRALRDAAGPKVTGALEGAKSEAKRTGIEGTPTVLIFRRGSPDPVRLEGDELNVDDVTDALDDALTGG